MAGLRVLVVHTQPEALGELVEVLSSPQLVVDTARSATEALHKVSAIDYAVIVTDHRPPTLDGFDLLDRTATFCPDAMRIVTSADAQVLEAPLERQSGANVFRVFARPWERKQLLGVVNEGLKLHRLEKEQRELIKKLSLEYQKLQKREKLLDVVVRERTKELEESYLKLKAANRQALLGLAEAIEAKDAYTKGHCGRVAGYSIALAQEAGYPEAELEALEFAAFLHDIGKIGVRDSVLAKPGPLDEQEWEHMRQHPVKGYEIASQIELLHPAMPAIRNHHERWDGKGYPDKLKGEDIPLSARIVAIADAYDAMATDRPYKKALPLEECEALLRRHGGGMYDPKLVEVFCRAHLGALYRDDLPPLTTEAEAGPDARQEAPREAPHEAPHSTDEAVPKEVTGGVTEAVGRA
jgi:HD-GYP domain-containing protein (c-di-GMP phosphodiesterase class II)